MNKTRYEKAIDMVEEVGGAHYVEIVAKTYLKRADQLYYEWWREWAMLCADDTLDTCPTWQIQEFIEGNYTMQNRSIIYMDSEMAWRLLDTVDVL